MFIAWNRSLFVIPSSRGPLSRGPFSSGPTREDRLGKRYKLSSSCIRLCNSLDKKGL